MRMIHCLTLIGAMLATLNLVPSDAHADSYKTLKCAPDQYNSNKTCKRTVKLKPSQTKEYRSTCTDETEYSVNCKPKNASVSCTVPFAIRDLRRNIRYVTCSCTNWDPTSKRNIKVTIDCSN